MLERFRSPTDADLFRIYVTDHRAGGTGARAMAERSRHSNSDNEFGEFLGWFVTQLDEELAELDRLCERCDFTLSRPKMWFARAGAAVGSLKLNGRLVRYSPLSRVLELELLRSGVAGKTRLWHTIMHLPAEHPAHTALDIDDMLSRADDQARRLDEFSARASAIAFGTGPAS